MIICSCAVITDAEVRSAVGWMRSADPQAIVTPGKLYRTLGKKPACGGCLPLLIESIAVEIGASAADELPAGLRNLWRQVGDGVCEGASTEVLAAE